MTKDMKRKTNRTHNTTLKTKAGVILTLQKPVWVQLLQSRCDRCGQHSHQTEIFKEIRDRKLKDWTKFFSFLCRRLYKLHMNKGINRREEVHSCSAFKCRRSVETQNRQILKKCCQSKNLAYIKCHLQSRFVRIKV